MSSVNPRKVARRLSAISALILIVVAVDACHLFGVTYYFDAWWADCPREPVEGPVTLHIATEGVRGRLSTIVTAGGGTVEDERTHHPTITPTATFVRVRLSVTDYGWQPGPVTEHDSCEFEAILPCEVDADCDDEDPCTADSCDFPTACVHEPMDCDDGDPCNGLEGCQGGVCVVVSLTDCNENDVADRCDIDEGSEDCNENGIPDECELGPRIFVRRSAGTDSGFLQTIERWARDILVDSTVPDGVAEDYDIIVLASNNTLSQADSDLLDDFVAKGGGLVILQDPPPRAYRGQASPVDSDDGWDTRIATLVMLPEHLLALRLGPVSGLEGPSTAATLKSGAEVVIEWDDATPMAAAYTYQSGQVVWFNDYWAYYQNNWLGDTTYGTRLMQNALLLVGGAYDCNTNGIPDACDIADGTSSDENHDGIPDEC